MYSNATSSSILSKTNGFRVAHILSHQAMFPPSVAGVFGFAMADASSDSAGAAASAFQHTLYLSNADVDLSPAFFPTGAPERRPLEWEEFVKTLDSMRRHW